MNYFQLFKNCLLVKGANRSLICDLQRGFSDFIPNDMVEIIYRLNARASIEDIILEYGKENEVIILEYLNFLDDKDYGFFCELDEFVLFPPLNTDFLVPALITNSVLELKQSTIHTLGKLIPQIENLGCKDVSIVFYEKLQLQDFNEIFGYFNDTRIKSFEITSKFHKNINDKFFKLINHKLNQLTRLVFFSAPKDEARPWDNTILFDRVFSTKTISSFKSCGVVDVKYFNTNLPKVVEAINHNSCLHKKMSVDINGNIKNCPSMTHNFGNIKETTLEEALNNFEFKKYWNINKDQISVCMDCEFRYVCTDCRAFTENPDDTYSKPLKCGYDPYTNQWEEWSTNPLKQKAIEHYGLNNY